MNHSKKCLNCEFEVHENFCCNCGQKTDIHRINFKNFITHDFLHGLFHVEKGMLFTAKESLIRPGKAALDYIEGKRVRYYNVFYFILLLIGLNLFLSNYYDQLAEIYNGHSTENRNDALGIKLEHFFTDYAKILIFSFVPLFALNSFILFRKRKLNFSEHIIIAGITFLGILLINTLDSIISFLDFTVNFEIISDIFSLVTGLLIFILPIFSYYQTFKDNYKKVQFSFRMILFTLFMLFELVFFLLIILGFLSNWKFGNVTFNT
ncbi:DUF3667 domain-containing protein [Flavobacterium sp.]|jgi:hypothetical protein|uniref:DUF3667 domain-containing protein n=1 Tax=Flavobacterium sp. TaxID=239 RepID=UPI0037C0BAE9